VPRFLSLVPFPVNVALTTPVDQDVNGLGPRDELTRAVGAKVDVGGQREYNLELALRYFLSYGCGSLRVLCVAKHVSIVMCSITGRDAPGENTPRIPSRTGLPGLYNVRLYTL